MVRIISRCGQQCSEVGRFPLFQDCPEHCFYFAKATLTCQELLCLLYTLLSSCKDFGTVSMITFRLEGTLKIISFQPPCHGPDHVAQTPVQPGLEHCQGGGSRNFSEQPMPGPHHPQSKEFLSYIQSKSTLFQFKTITPCPIATCPCKMSLSSSLVGPFRKAALRSPWSLQFSRLNSPNSLSLSSQQRDSSSRIIFMASPGPAPTGPCLSCAEGSRAGRRTPSGVSPEQNRGAESPPSHCWPCCWGCSLGYSWPSGLQVHTARSC